MNVSIHKNKVTSRRSSQRRDVPKNVSFETLRRWNQCRDTAEGLDFLCRGVESNVLMFPRGIISIS